MSGRAVQLTSAASARRAVAARIGKAARGGGRREIRPGAVLVTGSSGKGTTCRILAQLMGAAGLHPVLAAEGARHRPGLAAAMVAHTVVTGRMRTDPQATGLLEVEPGSLPQMLRREPEPAILVCTNLFRGQPDRHGETTAVTALVKRAMRALPASTTLILNADDPTVADLAADLPNPRLYFGVSDPLLGRLRADPAAAAARCPRCAGRLSYACAYYAHLGHWACGGCGRRRPEPDVSVTKIDLVGPSSSRLQVCASSTRTVLEVPLPGMYNAYNALAAVTTAMHLGLPEWALGAIEDVSGGPLRMERVRVAGHDVRLAVATNATEYAEVLRAVLGDGEPKRMLLGLSARQRREHDVSWIWDVDFESLAGLVPAAVVSGNRAADLAVRLKYAGWLGDGQDMGQSAGVTIEPDPVRAVRAAIAGTPPGEPLWVVSTAIALAEIRRWLRHHDEGLGPAIAHGGRAASPHARVLAAVQTTGPRPGGPGLSGPQPSGPQPSAPQLSGPQLSGPQLSGPQPAAPPFSGRRPDGRSARGRSSRRQPGQAGAAR